MQKITNPKKIEEAKAKQQELLKDIRKKEKQHGVLEYELREGSKWSPELNMVVNRYDLFIESMEYLVLTNKQGCFIV